jgi:hypothetical protein
MLEVTGDLAIHGVTKSVVVAVEVTGVAGSGRGGRDCCRKAVGLWDEGDAGGVGDEVKLIVALEGTRGR